MIHFKEIDSGLIDNIKGLFRSEGWSAYLDDDLKLKRAFDNSLYILGVFDDKELMGLSDALVTVNMRSLFRILSLTTNISSKVLENYLCIESLKNISPSDGFKSILIFRIKGNSFYHSLGMRTLEQAGIISFCR